MFHPTDHRVQRPSTRIANRKKSTATGFWESRVNPAARSTVTGILKWRNCPTTKLLTSDYTLSDEQTELTPPRSTRWLFWSSPILRVSPAATEQHGSKRFYSTGHISIVQDPH